MIETARHQLIADNPDFLGKLDLENECLELERIIRSFYYLNIHTFDVLGNLRYETEDFKGRHPKRSKRNKAENLYLESEHPSTYKKDDSEHYANKGSHIERTLGNERHRSAGHKEHWKKEKKKTYLKALGKI